MILILIIALVIIPAVNASTNNTSIDSINVTYNQKAYEKDLGNISVELPENTSGNLKAKIDEIEIYNENVSQKTVDIPIKIPESKTPMIVPNKNMDHTTHSIYLFFNDIELKTNHTLHVMKYNQSYEIQHFNDEILKDDNSAYVAIQFPSSAKGFVEVYIDGKHSETINVTQYLFLNITKFNKLSLGNHTVRIKYSGEDYYQPFDKNFSFEVVDMAINVPKQIILDHDDCITAKILNNTDGIISIYVDEKLILKEKLDSGEFLKSMFNHISCGEHEIKVTYNANNFSKTKKVNVNVTYTIDIFKIGSMSFGDENIINIIVPEDFNENLINITINNRKIDFNMDNQGWIDINISKLDAGNYTLTFSYPSDGKYYPQTLTENFTVNYKISISDFILNRNNPHISLTLPKDANGDLEAYIDGKLFKKVNVSNGKSAINISNLTPGKHELMAMYTGADYNVENADIIFYVFPTITTPHEMKFSEDKSITVKVNGNGYVSVSILNKTYNIPVENGKACLSLKNFKVGNYENVIVKYFDKSGFNYTHYCNFKILPPKIKISEITGSYNDHLKFKCNINGKLAKNILVTIKIGKLTSTIKTDKKGIATIKLTKDIKPGKTSVIINYKGFKVSKKITVKHALSLKTVKVKKSAKKLVITAKLSKNLKNKKIVFKFNGKKYFSKTNKKGVAKVTVKSKILKKLKIGKKITYQATYLKDTVKKTVKIKK